MARADKYSAYGAVVGALINRPVRDVLGDGSPKPWRPAPVADLLALVSLVTQAALIAVGVGCGLIYGVTLGSLESANVKLAVTMGTATFPYPDDHPETRFRNTMLAQREREREKDISRFSADPSEEAKLWLSLLREM